MNKYKKMVLKGTFLIYERVDLFSSSKKFRITELTLIRSDVSFKRSFSLMKNNFPINNDSKKCEKCTSTFEEPGAENSD
jgi:hypothetical protein